MNKAQTDLFFLPRLVLWGKDNASADIKEIEWGNSQSYSVCNRWAVCVFHDRKIF